MNLILHVMSLLMPCLTKTAYGHSVAGIFMANKEGTYTLNFTAARATCLFLNVTMATRSQMERAVQRGLETCRYGWIAEQIAVVPRLTSNNNCGKGKTGLVTWFAPADKPFNVFCFNESGTVCLLFTCYHLWKTFFSSLVSGKECSTIMDFKDKSCSSLLCFVSSPVVPTALIVVSIIILLLTAAGAVWYYTL
uniref:Lymphatic vessel endothelial hyaluronic acid receptor 1-like n=1 Tax=Acanthochromis polyacanthus TaxID=80966 RepID=A0A3Q1GHL4_9TELE